MRTLRTARTAFVFAVIFLAPKTGDAQSEGGALSDREFARYVVRVNLAEIREAHLALDHSKNDTVQRYAKMMLDDHTAAASDLAKIAGVINVTAPAAPTPDQSAEAAALASAPAADFDRKYMELQVSGHYKELAIVQTEVERGSDPIKSFAVQYLTFVQRHLRMAQSVVANADRYLK